MTSQNTPTEVVRVACDRYSVALDVIETMVGVYREVITQFRASGTFEVSADSRARLAALETDETMTAIDELDKLRREGPVTAPREAECAFCATHVTLIDGGWWADDGTLACTDTSAPYVPHKASE
jgi:hypothetical protein